MILWKGKTQEWFCENGRLTNDFVKREDSRMILWKEKTQEWFCEKRRLKNDFVKREDSRMILWIGENVFGNKFV